MARRETTKPHPYADIFPLHEGQPLWDLSDRIKANGLREPIVTLDDMILDGRRRELACFRAGVEPKYRKFGSRKEDGKDPLEFVIDTNLHRRHLGEGERSLAAARYATAKVGEAAKRQVGNSKQTSQVETFAGKHLPPTSAEAAEKFEVSEQAVDRAKTVLANGTPELQQAVAEDEITISDAAKVSSEPPEIQNAAVDAKKSGKAKSASAAAKKLKTEESKPTKDDEPWVDGWGIPITRKAEAAFRNQDKFDAIIKLLQQAKKLYKELADLPGGEFLQRCSDNSTSGFKHHGLETCILNLKDNRPMYTVCPYEFNKNHKHGKDCSMCHGLGWVPPIQKSMWPSQDDIDAAKKAHGVL